MSDGLASTCAYLREQEPGKATEDGRNIHRCLVHGHCTQEGANTPFASCASCPQRLNGDDPRLAKDFVDHMRVTDRHKSECRALRHLLAGRPAFLVCGGPSAKQLDLAKLHQRGVWSLAVNNAAAGCKVNAFVCSDPPSKFHDAIWLDPQVLKFVPSPKLIEKLGRLRTRLPEPVRGKCPSCHGKGHPRKRPKEKCNLCDGTGEYDNPFAPLLDADGKHMAACDCPNVWGFDRKSSFRPDASFFLDPSAPWGNHDAGVLETGEAKTVCTMLLGLRILYYLGARRIYLIGVDFFMDPTRKADENYSFGELRDGNACHSNNDQFRIVNRWLCKMQESGVFAKFGLEIYNCNPLSHLRAFAHVPYEMAIADCRKGFEPEPLNAAGWYVK